MITSLLPSLLSILSLLSLLLSILTLPIIAENWDILYLKSIITKIHEHLRTNNANEYHEDYFDIKVSLLLPLPLPLL